MRIEIVEQYEKLSELKPIWNRLLAESAYDNIFLTFEWFDTFIKNFELTSKISIILIYDNSNLVGILPLYNEALQFMSVNYKALKSIANVHTPKFNFIVKRGYESLIAGALGLSRHYLSWDVIIIEYVSEGSGLLARLEEGKPWGLVVKSQAMLRSPYVLIDCDWNEFYGKELLRSYRKSIAYLERRAERDYGYELESIKGSLLSPEILMEALVIEDKGWKGQNKSSIIKDPRVKSFYTELAFEMNRQGWFNLDFLKLSGKRVAFDYCLKYNSYYCTVKIGYDEDYKELSPGRILRKLSLKKAFYDGCSIYDMLGGNDEYKTKWTSNLDVLLQTYIFSTGAKAQLLKVLMFSGKELAERFGIKDIIKQCYLKLCAVRRDRRLKE